jgi:FKBP12-rapamycin complex-associated protein
LLRAGVTWYEKVVKKITDTFDFYALQQFDLMVETLRSITRMVKKPKCALHEQFNAKYSTNIAALERILRVFSPHNKGQMGQLTQWCKTMQSLVQDDLKMIRIIQLSSISESLAEKTHFQLAVPGTYKPCKPIIRIRYFVGQFTVYMTKQQPKDVVIRGEDGNFYQYLVKGHEDLRLDERIMQFFRLINTYLKSETCFASQVIQTTSVIPLSISTGLVQWVPGTDTLRSVVEQYRRLTARDPIHEFNLTENLSYTSFDCMMPIQKMNIIKKVISAIPDTDIANFIYLKAKSAEIWHKQTFTFAISAAITSMVGYVIGLGDRHPSNLLIDRFTGRIIHIDFGDCFEKAAKRKFLPEVVPFRLTRMMVKAMGVTGASGTFKEAFINTSRILRENKRVLIMVLAIFVHEPLVDPRERISEPSSIKNAQMSFVGLSRVTGSVIDKGRVLFNEPSDKTTNTEMRARVNQKLSGMEFDGNPLSVKEQAELLIKQATDLYNLSKMYSGWCPFW